MAKSDVRQIVITGVSRGLGLAMVEGFVERGHTVHGCARSKDAVMELRRRFGEPHSFDAVDVSSDAAVAKWAEQVLTAGSAPDLLINNAAVILPNQQLWKVGAEAFSQIIDVNVKGTVNVIRHFLPAMMRRKRGVVVNFSSGWGRTTSPDVASYCATKWAIEGLTRALAEELPEGLAAVALNPGIIDTDMLRSCFGGDAAAYPKAEKWANQAVPFLLSLGSKDNGKPLTVPGARIS